jgi:hypothetical protein
MNQLEITEVKEFEIDPRGGPNTREVQQEESKKASEASQLIVGKGKLSPWKFPRKKTSIQFVHAAVT